MLNNIYAFGGGHGVLVNAMTWWAGVGSVDGMAVAVVMVVVG